MKPSHLPDFGPPDSAALALLLQQIHREPRDILRVQEQPDGPQGASGSAIRYFSVSSTSPGGESHTDTVVTKSASLLERRVLQLLSSQGCAVPPVYIPDVVSDEPLPVLMPYLEPRTGPDMLGSPESPLTRSVADGLAGIHAANLGRPPSWLPHTSEDYLRRLWLYAWREQWEANLAESEFAAEFGDYTARLDAAMERFMGVLAALTAEGTTLTVLNVDLIPDHIRIWRGGACFIDWQQSSYGALYLDLPNYFTIETALLYRDALARHGHEIPVVEFLERYHEVGRYMGLRYLGYSLWRWAQGGEERRQGRWFLYYTFSLALHGR